MKISLPRYIPFLLLTSSLFFVFCKSEEKSSEPKIDGVYESVGYGRIVKIKNGEYLLADVTKFSCIPLMDGKISEFEEALQLKNDTLSLKDGINTYYFTRIDDAPAVCKSDTPEYKEAESKANDPEHNFEVLWDTFKNHYAYFELRGVDPAKMYAEYRPKVTSETSAPELFFIFNEMLESFEDGHIGISAPDEIEEAANALHDAQQISRDAQNENETEKPKERLRNYEVAAKVAKQYIPEGTSIKNGNLRWGILKDNIGYLQVNQMMGMADYAINDTLSYRDHWMAYFEKAEESDDDNGDEISGILTSMNVIMKDLENTDAFIIDVRFNGGGKDEVGMMVLERLNDIEKIVFSKKGRFGDGFTPVNMVTQPASENPYRKPVYLLISSESASATEIMALSSLSMPNITKIGSRTEGVFSDVLDKTLPNGWEFGLSSEVYLDLNGINYEGKGIPPDVEIDYSRDTQEFLQKVVNDLKTDGDAAIEKALELFEVKK